MTDIKVFTNGREARGVFFLLITILFHQYVTGIAILRPAMTFGAYM